MITSRSLYGESLTSLGQLALVHTEVLPSTVLLEHLDLVPQVHEVMGEVDSLPKEHHAHTHITLHRGPQQWCVLEANTHLTFYDSS